MKHLLFLVSFVSMAGSYVSSLSLDNNADRDKLTYNVNANSVKQDNLPVPNVRNWDLSTGQGFFQYLSYVFFVSMGYHDFNVDTVSNDGTGALEDNNWNDNNTNYIGNTAYLKESVSNKSKTLLDSSRDILTNNTDEEQTMTSSSYSHSETKSKSVSLGVNVKTGVKIDCFIEGAEFTVTVDETGTWTTTTTDTFNANPQNVKVPAHSQVELDYSFYSTTSSFVNAAVYRKIDSNNIINWTIGYSAHGIIKGYQYNWSIQKWVDWIHSKNLDCLLHIQNGYLSEAKDGIYARAYSAKYTGIGTEFHVTIGEPQPIIG